jgi:hypothetical protein
MTIVQKSDLAKILSSDMLQQCYRRHNLRVFLGTSGHTQVSISKALGYSNSTFLGQMVGAYPIRPITERTVRKIEEAFNLERLSLDKATDISIDDLSEIDRRKLNLSDDTLSDGYLMNKRKHARNDYSKYADKNATVHNDASGIRYSNNHFDSSNIRHSQLKPSVEQQSGEPAISESAMLELIDLIDSSELSSDKAMKVLKMSVKDGFKKLTLDKEFVQNLIDLTK